VPVGSFPANSWGLQDMHGNVWEWVEDCRHEDYTDAPKDGQAWLEANGGNCRARVLRGGSWNFDPVPLDCAFRLTLVTGSRNSNLGFRVVCSSPTF